MPPSLSPVSRSAHRECWPDSDRADARSRSLTGGVYDRRFLFGFERGDLFEKRRRLMNEWAKYCAKPMAKESTKVVALRRS